MIKKLTLLFTLNTFFFLGFSQTYVPLPLQNCSWFYSKAWGTSNSGLMQTCMYNENHRLYPNGDTLISGKHYIKIYDTYLSGSGGNVGTSTGCSTYTPPPTTLSCTYGLRQDTLGKKIYMKTFGGGAETLLYDFNLVKKDTVKTFIGDFGGIPPCGTTRYRVIDTVYYQAYSDGICRKTYKLKPYINCANFGTFTYIIEGFGTEYQLIDKFVGTNSNFGGFGSGSFTAYNTSTLVINTTTLAIVTNTCSQTVGIAENNISPIKIYPNPTNDKIIIENPENKDFYLIELISITGEKLSVPYLKENQKIILNTNEIPAGVYIIHINSTQHENYRRIIKMQ